jgi:hypothetical protein
MANCEETGEMVGAKSFEKCPYLSIVYYLIIFIYFRLFIICLLLFLSFKVKFYFLTPNARWSHAQRSNFV